MISSCYRLSPVCYIPGVLVGGAEIEGSGYTREDGLDISVILEIILVSSLVRFAFSLTT